MFVCFFLLRSPIILTFESYCHLFSTSHLTVHCRLSKLSEIGENFLLLSAVAKRWAPGCVFVRTWNFCFILLKGRISQCILYSKTAQKPWAVRAVNASFSKRAREPECTQSAAPVNTLAGECSSSLGAIMLLSPWFLIQRVMTVRYHHHFCYCYYCCFEKVRDIPLHFNLYLRTYLKS